MTFEEAVKELNKLFEFPDVPEHMANDYDYEFAGSRCDVIEIIEKLQETYASKPKMTKKYIELYDDGLETPAVDALNSLSKDHEVTIEGYRLVRYEEINKERTYILASYEVSDG